MQTFNQLFFKKKQIFSYFFKEISEFHGVVFSIIFNKPFWALGNIGRGNTRFDSILSLFGLKDRLIDINSIDILNHDFTKSIDWNYVNEKLAKERIKSIDFICRTLSKNRNY